MQTVRCFTWQSYCQQVSATGNCSCNCWIHCSKNSSGSDIDVFCLSRLSTTFGTRPDTSACVKPSRTRRHLYHVPSWSGIYLPDNRIRCSSTRLRPQWQFRPRRLHWPQPLPQHLLPHQLPNVPLLPLTPLLLPHLRMRPMMAETFHLPLQQLGIIDHRNCLPITENHPLQGKFRILLMTALKFVSLISGCMGRTEGGTEEGTVFYFQIFLICHREADPDPIVTSNSSADSESGAQVSLSQSP